MKYSLGCWNARPPLVGLGRLHSVGRRSPQPILGAARTQSSLWSRAVALSARRTNPVFFFFFFFPKERGWRARGRGIRGSLR